MMAMSLIISKNISLLHLVCSVSGVKFANKNKQTNKESPKRVKRACLHLLVQR